jgi:hypothetical protein
LKLVSRCLVAIALYLAVVSGRFSAEPADQQAVRNGSSSISGSVKDGSGRSVSSVAVTLESPGHGSHRTETDGEGDFVFGSLPAGQYRISATKAGFAVGAFGRAAIDGPSADIELMEGQALTGVGVVIWKLGTVSGSVIDDYREPVVAIRVCLLGRTSGSPGRWLSAGCTSTDDRGSYRISLLKPGDYVPLVPTLRSTIPQEIVGADAALTGSSTPGNPTIKELGGAPSRDAASDRSKAVYPTTFLGDSMRLATARHLRIAEGDDVPNADIELRPTPSFAISGTLTSDAGPAPYALVQLFPAIDNLDGEFASEFDSARTYSDSKGAFVLAGIPAGNYRLVVLGAPWPNSRMAAMLGLESALMDLTNVRALERPMWTWTGPPQARGVSAIEDVAVVGKDETLTVRLAQAPTVSGHATVRGLNSDSFDRSLFSRLYVETVPASVPLTRNTRPGWLDYSGNFQTWGSVPGRYALHVGGEIPGWQVVAALYDGVDLLDQSFDLRADDMTGVELVLERGTPTLSGVIRTRKGSLDTTATVLVFPQDRATWDDVATYIRRVASARPNNYGRFSLKDLPPGDYRAVAIPAEVAGAPIDRVLLERLLPASTAVHMHAGRDETINLTTIPATPLSL